MPKYNNKIEITHNIYDKRSGFRHSLTVNGKESIKVGYADIARNGSFAAITSYHSDWFPEIFLITNFSSISMKSTIQTNGIKKTTKVV